MTTTISTRSNAVLTQYVKACDRMKALDILCNSNKSGSSSNTAAKFPVYSYRERKNTVICFLSLSW